MTKTLPTPTLESLNLQLPLPGLDAALAPDLDDQIRCIQEVYKKKSISEANQWFMMHLVELSRRGMGMDQILQISQVQVNWLLRNIDPRTSSGVRILQELCLTMKFIRRAYSAINPYLLIAFRELEPLYNEWLEYANDTCGNFADMTLVVTRVSEFYLGVCKPKQSLQAFEIGERFRQMAREFGE